MTAHLLWATNLARNVRPEFNAYGTSPVYLKWPGVAGAAQYECRAMCNHFLNLSVRQGGKTDSWFASVFGVQSPLAKDWHDAIAGGKVAKVSKVTDIRPGDILAVKYLDEAEHTGHVMIATDIAKARTAASPLVQGTAQYTIRIVDSANSGHGSTDTRRQPDGSMTDGAGEGILRLYVDATGVIVGHSWSVYANSDFHGTATRPLLVGRL